MTFMLKEFLVHDLRFSHNSVAFEIVYFIAPIAYIIIDEFLTFVSNSFSIPKKYTKNN